MLMFPKPERRTKRIKRQEQERRVLRDACRRIVIARQHGRCYICGYYLGSRLHVHEVVPRSLGGDPHDPENCAGLCAHHHERITRHDLDLLWHR
jgi:predicted restriction endonuclease